MTNKLKKVSFPKTEEKKTKYAIVTGGDIQGIELFITKVAAMIKDGWKCEGGILVYRGTYYQSLTK